MVLLPGPLLQCVSGCTASREEGLCSGNRWELPGMLCQIPSALKLEASARAMEYVPG